MQNEKIRTTGWRLEIGDWRPKNWEERKKVKGER